MLEIFQDKRVKYTSYLLGGILFLYIIRKKIYTTYTESNWKDDLVNPIKGKVGSGFGGRVNPITRVWGFHNGVDIGAPLNTPILAPLNGVVSAKYTNSSGGNQLIIDSGYPKFGFAHLNKYPENIKVGSVVTRGQVIGYVGTTGMSTGNHLHFVLRLNDVPMDATKYFSFK
jgi:murein DD-endopeptidase MepM/ murein hydrolase activator NlpD